MKIRNALFFAALIVLNLMFAGNVQAGEWNVTFNVPLSVTGLDSAVVKLDLSCKIKDHNGVKLGQNIVGVPITGGAYSGPPVSVSVHANGMTNPTEWRCDISSLWDINNKNCVPMAYNPVYAFCKIKLEGTGATVVTGKF